MNKKWIGANPRNYEVGRKGRKIEYIILHWIVGTLSSADSTFQNPSRIASAHYGIGGENIHQYVKEEDTAYHCGNYDMNTKSIGIEHEGSSTLPISEETYKTSGKLVAEIARTYNIPLDRDHIKGHREIKETQCPGTLDIDRVIREAKQQDDPMVCDPKSVRDEFIRKATNWDETEKLGVHSIAYVQQLINDQELLHKNEEMNKQKDTRILELEKQLKEAREALFNTEKANLTLLEKLRIAGEAIAKDAIDDRDTLLELKSTQEKLSYAQGILGLIATELEIQTSYEKADDYILTIERLKKPHDEVVKEYNTLAQALEEMVFYKRVPKKAKGVLSKIFSFFGK